MATTVAVKPKKLSRIPTPAEFIDSLTIEDPQGDVAGIVPFDLWPAQVQVLEHFERDPLCIVLKARQLGISWLACAYALWLCVFHPQKTVLIFSKGEDEAAELVRRIDGMYRRIADKTGLPSLVVGNTREIMFSNGSRVKSQPATKHAGSSFTASLVIADEFAKMQWADELYTSMKPTIDGGGKLIIISTAVGARGLFYNLWQKAEKGLNRFKAIFLDWRARPDRDEAWYARVASEAVSSSLMAQEYPAHAAEAFSATDVEKFMPSMLWWDACKVDMPPMDTRTPLVLSADAGINNDSFALTATSRHWVHEDAVAVRYVREWKLSKSRPVDFPEVEAEIRRLCETFDVVEFSYDPYQLHDMGTRLQRDGVVKTRPFPQGADRLEADKQLLDLVVQRRLFHDGNAMLREHVDNSDKKIDSETRRLRIIKREESKKIDLCVSLSMSAYRCLKLPL